MYCFVVFFPSIQAVAESCYYGTEIPLPCMRNLKTGPHFSVASVLEVNKNSIVKQLQRVVTMALKSLYRVCEIKKTGPYFQYLQC